MAKIIITIPGNGGGSGIVEHNELDGLQGLGQDYYHLNQAQYNSFLELIYTELITTLAVSPTIGERGLNTTLTLSYNIISNDDIITSANINNGIGSVISDVDNGTSTKTVSDISNNQTYTLTTSYTRNGQTGTNVKNISYITYLPQWSGITSFSDLDTYSYNQLNSNLTKVVQQSVEIEKVFAPNNQYVYFISTKSNAKISNSGFEVTIGEWTNSTTAFIKRPLELQLANGTTIGNLTLYRSRIPLTHENQTYKIF